MLLYTVCYRSSREVWMFNALTRSRTRLSAKAGVCLHAPLLHSQTPQTGNRRGPHTRTAQRHSTLRQDRQHKGSSESASCISYQILSCSVSYNRSIIFLIFRKATYDAKTLIRNKCGHFCRSSTPISLLYKG